MKKAVVFGLFIIGLWGCGEGGTLSPEVQSTLSSLLSGFSLPSGSNAVTAVPTATSTITTSTGTSTATGETTTIAKSCITAETRAKVTGLSKYSDPGTDYSNAVTRAFVEEPVLDQFKIVGQILDWLAQTHYSAEENINKGPYRALVSSLEEEGGVQRKNVESWIVDSKLEGDAIVVSVWVEGGQVRAKFRFFRPSSTTSVGCGGWEVNASFQGGGFFTLKASENPDGTFTYKMDEGFNEMGHTFKTKAILNQGINGGHGKVLFTESPGSKDCLDITRPCTFIAKYAYNDTHLAVHEEGDPSPLFKKRNDFVQLSHHYALFDSETGVDIIKKKKFGFPIVYKDSFGMERHGFYTAWQGRHEIHTDSGELIPAGLEVMRAFPDDPITAVTEKFTTSPLFKGILAKRTVKPSDINILLKTPIEIYDDRHFNLIYDGTKWIDCKELDFTFPLACKVEMGTEFTAFAMLVSDPNDQRRFVNINGGSGNLQYLCILNANNVCDFFEATFDVMTGRFVPTNKKLSPSAGTPLFVNISGSLFIEYKGGTPVDTTPDWVVKKVIGFDQQAFRPIFDETATGTPFFLEVGREFYVHQQASNYVLKNTGSAYDLKVELQAVANPVNADKLYNPNWILKFQFGGPDDSTYRFITDSNAKTSTGTSTHLKLVYNTVGKNDLQATTGAVVERGIWGLVAHEVSGTTSTPVVDLSGNQIQFNWEFPPPGERWGTVQYLKRADGSLVFLDDPIRLQAIPLTDASGAVRDYHLEYDGWLNGLPDFFREIEFNDFNISDDIKNKVVNIPEGTILKDENSTTTYVIKPLEVSIFMRVVPKPNTNLDISLGTAGSLSLDNVPSFTDPMIGTTPLVQPGIIKYSEGVKL